MAVNRPGIMTREFYYPVLDTFMRALPFAYRKVQARAGTLAEFRISGECGGTWFLFRKNGAWALTAAPLGEISSETTIPQEIAWRIFTKGIKREEAEPQVRVTGNAEISLHILGMISIVG